MKRDFDDPLYKDWRKKVVSRDNRKCKMPGCHRSGKRIQAHHIKRWADFPTLRYEEANGITLCFFCHSLVSKNEVYYEPLFTEIINSIYGDNSGH